MTDKEAAEKAARLLGYEIRPVVDCDWTHEVHLTNRENGEECWNPCNLVGELITDTDLRRMDRELLWEGGWTFDMGYVSPDGRAIDGSTHDLATIRAWVVLNAPKKRTP